MNGISIIIPLYNKENTIQNCLKNLLEQSNINFEIIIVNDGSTDTSIDKLEPFLDKISLIHQTNQGPSAARNNGAAHAQYDVLSFLDADDQVSPDFVESHLSLRRDFPEVDLSLNSFNVYEADQLQRSEKLSLRSTNLIKEKNYYFVDEFRSSLVANIHSGGYCVNKALFLQCGGFDINLRCWEITDALTKFSLLANKIGIIDEVLSFKYEDASNSLFQKERRNLIQHRIYCNNMFNRLGKIPDHSKQQYFNEIKYLCINYWLSLKLFDLVDLYKKAKILPGADKMLSLPLKIELTVKLISIIYFIKN